MDNQNSGHCFFAKLIYEPSLPEISANLNKNKNEIPVFSIPSDPRKGSGFYYYYYWCICTQTLENISNSQYQLIYVSIKKGDTLLKSSKFTYNKEELMLGLSHRTQLNIDPSVTISIAISIPCMCA